MFIELPIHVISAEYDPESGEYLDVSTTEDGTGPTGIIEMGIIGIRQIAYCIPAPDRGTCNIMLDNGSVLTVMESYDIVRQLVARAANTGRLSVMSEN